jgi:hypothetical protein
LILVLVALIVLGSVAVIAVYGLQSFLGALPCLVVGAIVIAALYLVLAISERWTNRY